MKHRMRLCGTSIAHNNLGVKLYVQSALAQEQLCKLLKEYGSYDYFHFNFPRTASTELKSDKNESGRLFGTAANSKMHGRTTQVSAGKLEQTRAVG